MNIPNQLKTSDGKEVFITPGIKEHLLAHADVVEFLEEAVAKLEIPDGIAWIGVAVNLGRNVGISKLVKVGVVLPGQKTFFAKRIAHEFPTHVVLEREGEWCDSVTLEVKYDKNEKKYFLNTAHFGFPCPDEPFCINNRESNEFKESLDFWRRHALVYEEKIMAPVFKAAWEDVLK
jgi:hypothetical protein